MERFVIIVNGFKPLTIITKHPILDVAAVLDPPLCTVSETDDIAVQYKQKTKFICNKHFRQKIKNCKI